MADQQQASSSSSTAAPAAAVTESTPLLQAISTDGVPPTAPAPAPPLQETTGRTRVDRLTYGLTTASVCLSPLTIALAIAMAIALIASPGGNRYNMNYSLRDAYFPLNCIAAVTTILSSTNFVRYRRSLSPFPLVINTIVDGVAGLYACVFAIEPLGRGDLSFGYCSTYNRPSAEECERFRRWFGVLVLLFLIAGLCLGLCHLVLFVLRLVRVVRSRNWNDGRISIPTGQLTFEFTIKLLRQESAVREQVVREPTASGSATTARAAGEEMV